MSYRIGDFEFIHLSRVLSYPRMRGLREVRPGQAGTTFWRQGRGGEPFQLASVVNAAGIASAESLIHQYEQLVYGEPVTAAWAGIELASLQVLVLDVQPIDEGVHAMLLGIGGVGGGSSFGLCRALWTVEVIDPSL
jgi:hypothetical protein